MNIALELPQHAHGIEALLDLSFGPHRTAKTAYRLREGVAPVPELSLIATDDATGALDGTIRFWPILIGGRTPTLLLGPIAVAPHRRGTGLGGALILSGLDRARQLGWRSTLLVGDAPYYSRFGFTRELTRDMAMPGPVELSRFLGLELVPGGLAGAGGLLGRWPAGRPLPGAEAPGTDALGADAAVIDRARQAVATPA
ncbi:GNAT family N-acetyltransferase [Arenibaculum pallidiluteum]|uniref:GNAT family N-acetyltransferase n=1 Tax=Arenibaculum pallidiluteum TaxID=2812559 RepID=UPI001A96DE81|nr:N-acetyltransferase [Arenibaculum pallidiluteum]